MKIIPLLYLLGTFQGLFLAFSLAGKTQKARKFLIALLIISSGYFLFQFFVFERYLDKYPHLIGIYLPVLFMVPPLLFQMVRFEVDSKARLSWSDLLHFIPFLVVSGIMLPYYQTPAGEKLRILFTHTEAHSLYPLSMELAALLWLLTFVYVLSAIRLIKNAKAKKNEWLRNYCYLFLILLIVFLISELIVMKGTYHHYTIQVNTAVTFSLLIHFVGYAALKETGFMKPRTGQNTLLSNELKTQLKTRLMRVLNDEKLFTDSTLSSRKLCKELGTNNKYLSIVVNEEFNCSITSLINSYRIDEAKRMLLNSQYKHLNFLGIAMSVGFNNKNSFTRTFKRHTGTTPSSFRDSI